MRAVRFRAFTIVELIIVVAIVAVLLAITLPALNRARELSRRTVCSSNIGQLTAAWIMYAGENKGRVCCPHATPLSWNNGMTPVLYSWGWVGNGTVVADRLSNGKLWPYLRNPNVYLCPDDPQLWHVPAASASVNITVGSSLVRGATGTSYCINALLGAHAILNGQSIEPAAVSQPAPIIYSLSQIKNATRTFVFIETAENFPGAPDVIASPISNLFPPPIYPLGIQKDVLLRPGLYHRAGSGPEGCTISFADGHVVFWSYSSAQITQEWAASAGPDLLQLAAWGGGPVPPGVVP